MAIHLVRHGQDYGEGLTELGLIQAGEARDKLIGMGLAENATILSSSADRAIQTAQIIAKRVGQGAVLASKIIYDAGHEPTAVKDFDQVVQIGLHEHGIEEVPEQLVIVAHMPLLAHIQFGNQYRQVSNGAIVQYESGTWSNPKFDPNSFLAQEFAANHGLA